MEIVSILIIKNSLIEAIDYKKDYNSEVVSSELEFKDRVINYSCFV